MRTIFLVHGWNVSEDDPWLPDVKDTLLKQVTATFIFYLNVGRVFIGYVVALERWIITQIAITA